MNQPEITPPSLLLSGASPGQKRKRKRPEKTARLVAAHERRKGSGNPNWRGGKTTLKCIHCGTMFSVMPSRSKKAKFCSLKCWSHAQSGKPRIRKTPKRGETIISKSCKLCGAEFKIPFRMRSLKSFCSRECRLRNRTLMFSGENHPQFKGASIHVCEQCGKTFNQRGKRRFCSVRCSKPKLAESRLNDGRPRKTTESERVRSSDEYAAWRTAVFTRDGFKCRQCGENGRLTAHHIRRFSTHPELRLFVPNGITLCWPCHGLIRGREEELEAQFYAKVETLL